MSNARSPRDVCSTTIGISGLMVLALFRLPGSIPPGKCKAAPPPSRVYQPALRRSSAVLDAVRCPMFGGAQDPGVQSFSRAAARSGRDRDRRLDEALERLLGRDVVAQVLEAAGPPQLRQQLRGLGDAPALVGLDAALERGEQLLVGRLDLPRPRRSPRSPPRRAARARRSAARPRASPPRSSR